MDIKRTFLHIMICVFFFTSCGLFDDDGGCGDENDIAPSTVEDLVIISPLETNFTKGDTIRFSLSIPNVNSFFQNAPNPFDLFEETGIVQSRILFLDHRSLTEGNDVTIDSGFLEGNGNTFVIYNEENDLYEIDFQVIFNREGTYQIETAYRVGFPSDRFCNFVVDTNIQGFDPNVDSFYTFEVNP